MATLQTKEHQTRRTTGTPPVEPGPERRGWAALVIALVAVVAVAATLLVVIGAGSGGQVPGGRPAESEQGALERLVNEGYIPRAALENAGSDAADPGGDGQDLTERFQNEGLIPR
jgi:hypothetical protein